ncbi:MAG: GguC protein, partial [Terriglobales bacterium]
MRLLQLRDTNGQRRVGLVDEPAVRLLDGLDSFFALAERALSSGESLASLVQQLAGNVKIPYDEIYEGGSAWRILPAIDHPLEPTRCLVTGTGLTHLKSA